MNTDAFLLFFFTTLVVVFSPGPAALLTAGQGATHGVKGSVAGTLGIACANVVYFLLSATGVSALILTSNQLFALIKWIGVAYLVYLGVMAIFSSSGGIVVRRQQTRYSALNYFYKGFLIEISNPKALIYFSALLPQFIDLSKPLLTQLVIMGGVTFFLDFICYNAYGMLGHTLSRRVVKANIIKIINTATGGFLLYVASKVAMLERA